MANWVFVRSGHMKEKIGLIGAGTMGMGVAEAFAMNAYDVLLIDINQQILDSAKETIYQNMRYHKLFQNQDKKCDPKDAIKNITFSTEYETLKDVEYIIENVNENWEIKKQVYLKLNEICSNDCVFMVNTSCLSITKLASLTDHPEKVIGTHFMNPVSLKKSIEVISGYHTSKDTILKVENLLNNIGKEIILVNDFPGFVSNRISHLFMNEAAFVVQDKVAEPENVDKIFKDCFGHKMGPLETADLIGLDTVVDSLNVLYESYQDSKFKCCPLLQKMVDAGLTGKKSGKGFYTY